MNFTGDGPLTLRRLSEIAIKAGYGVRRTSMPGRPGREFAGLVTASAQPEVMARLVAACSGLSEAAAVMRSAEARVGAKGYTHVWWRTIQWPAEAGGA